MPTPRAIAMRILVRSGSFQYGKTFPVGSQRNGRRKNSLASLREALVVPYRTVASSALQRHWMIGSVDARYFVGWVLAAVH